MRSFFKTQNWCCKQIPLWFKALERRQKFYQTCLDCVLGSTHWANEGPFSCDRVASPIKTALPILATFQRLFPVWVFFAEFSLCWLAVQIYESRASQPHKFCTHDRKIIVIIIVATMITTATIYWILTACKHLNIWKQLKHEEHSLNVDFMASIQKWLDIVFREEQVRKEGGYIAPRQGQGIFPQSGAIWIGYWGMPRSVLYEEWG